MPSRTTPTALLQLSPYGHIPHSSHGSVVVQCVETLTKHLNQGETRWMKQGYCLWLTDDMK